MLPKFNHCCIPKNRQIVKSTCCNPKSIGGPGAVPDSVRMQTYACSDAIVTTQLYTPPGYDPMSGMSTMSTTMQMCGSLTTTKIYVPVPEGSRPPVVQVGNLPASITTQQRATEAVSSALDRYDPVKRFAKYFPPAPLPYICPERIPNNIPIPSDSVCLPNESFITSAQLSTMEGVSTIAGLSTITGPSTPTVISTIAGPTRPSPIPEPPRTIQRSEIPKPVQRAEIHKPVQRLEIPKFVQRAEIPKPVPRTETPKPATHSKTPQPKPRAETTKPPPRSATPQPVPRTEIPKPDQRTEILNIPKLKWADFHSRTYN